jgi:FkbM family methyltransferase
MFENGQSCTFIQIGAYDGISTDPLNKYIERHAWRGIMLEPQPGPANRLRDLYKANDRITILEAAVDSHRGTRPLFTVEGDHLPCWAGGMASFDRDHILKHKYLIPGIESMVRELTVQCMPIGDVLDRLPSPTLDLLQIDAEGADGYILSLFPFDRMKPAIIHWETKNMTRLQQEEALDIVSDQGYLVARSGGEDMLAVLPAN